MPRDAVTTIAMLDAPCDRCGKLAAELHPYKLADSITYRGKVVEFPWLCVKCFKAEKVKWWKVRSHP